MTESSPDNQTATRDPRVPAFTNVPFLQPLVDYWASFGQVQPSYQIMPNFATGDTTQAQNQLTTPQQQLQQVAGQISNLTYQMPAMTPTRRTRRASGQERQQGLPQMPNIMNMTSASGVMNLKPRLMFPGMNTTNNETTGDASAHERHSHSGKGKGCGKK